MPLALFDSHSHLDAPEFDDDRAVVLQRAHDAGVTEQLVPAVDHDSWPRLREVCAAVPGLYPAYGLHPMYLHRHRPEHLPALREWIERERPRAIGECGLDFFVDGLDAELQRHYLRKQLELAREFDLPVVLHARRAVEEITATLRGIGGLRGVVHSYSGSEEQARQLFGMGFMIGIGGPLTYDRAKRLHRLVAAMPLEFLLLETDSPDQPDALNRGQRNEPARLQLVLDAVARLRNSNPDEIASATRANARRLLGL
ncbi:MAG: TatD family hydrolase [Gammaproteobacteria bacterium]|nr:TatD family hydrolase [Gammaproteobacteria bacterium]